MKLWPELNMYYLRKTRRINLVKSQTVQSLTKFIEETINNYDSIELQYGNIFHDVSNKIDLTL
jgi:hypothetical protein